MLKHSLKIAFALMCALCCPAQDAQAAWPERPVNFVVGSGAGSSLDMVGRVLTQELSERFGQPFVVTNVSGGGLGAFAMTMKNAKADGYKIGFGIVNNFNYPVAMGNAPFKLSDFYFPCSVFMGDASYICGPDRPWKHIREAFEWSAKTGAPLNCMFQNATDRIQLELLAREVPGAKLNLMPGKSPSFIVTSVMGGHVDIGCSAGLHYEQDRAGKVKTLTLTLDKRTSHYPSVPTTLELFKSAVPTSGYLRVIVMPAGVPREARVAMEKALKEIIARPDFEKKVDAQLHFFIKYLENKALMKYMDDDMKGLHTLLSFDKTNKK